MEKNINRKAEVNSTQLSSIASLEKKRKWQAELGMPFAKHMCLDRSLQRYFSSNTNPRAKEVYSCIIRGETSVLATGDKSEPELVKGRNNFPGYTDSVMSTFGGAKTDFGYPQSASDQPSTSTVTWGDTSSMNALYIKESNSNKTESSCMSEEHDCPHHDFGFYPSLNDEEHLLEFGNLGTCGCSRCRMKGIDRHTEKELQELVSSNGMAASSNYVLSSGRWSVNQDKDNQHGSEKLTIDMEFEQYFSMLML